MAPPFTVGSDDAAVDVAIGVAYLGVFMVGVLAGFVLLARIMHKRFAFAVS